MFKLFYVVYFMLSFIGKVLKYTLKVVYTFLVKGGFKRMDGQLEFFCHISGQKHISIGKGSVVLKDTILNVWEGCDESVPEIMIGENTFIGEHSHISACNKILIGDNVLTGRYVLISDNNHGEFNLNDLNIHPLKRKLIVKGPIVIEDNVWIGERVCVLSNVTIGKGAVIAANSVVTKNVPPYSLVAGVPSKIIKSLL